MDHRENTFVDIISSLIIEYDGRPMSEWEIEQAMILEKEYEKCKTREEKIGELSKFFIKIKAQKTTGDVDFKEVKTTIIGTGPVVIPPPGEGKAINIIEIYNGIVRYEIIDTPKKI